MIVEIQVVPKRAGTKDNVYAFVDVAIAVLEESELHHEVGALGTTFDGDPDVAWGVIRKMTEETLSAGADSTLAHIKVAYIARDMNSLTNKFR